MKPYEQIDQNDGTFVRKFNPNVHTEELQWHFDEKDRLVTPLNENDWLIQFDNQLPTPFNKEILIPKNVYHRIIKGTTDLNVHINEVHWDSGLGKWLKEKWVDISRKDKSGKHPPCGASAEKEGRDKDQKKAYPKCRPAKEAGSMSKKEKKKAVSQKRRAEKKSGHHKGRKPVMVSHKKMDENIINEGKNKPNNPSLWARAKAAAKAKFDVYPSAYANLWASKWYKNHGGTWRKVNESNLPSFSEWLDTKLNNGNEDELRQE